MNNKLEILDMVRCGKLSPEEGALRLKQIIPQVKYFVEEWLEESIENGIESNHKIVFFCDHLMKKFIETQFIEHRFIFITKESAYACISEVEYCINHKEERDYRDLFQHIMQLGMEVDAIVHLWSIDSEEEEIEDSGYSILNIGKQLLNYKLKQEIQLLYCYCEEGRITNVAHKAVYSIFRSLEEETSKLIGKTIAVERKDRESILQIVKKELEKKEIVQVQYQHERRLVKHYKMLSNQEQTDFIRPNGNYLIAGGAGALGRMLTATLLEQEKEINIIWCGRSEKTDIPSRVRYMTCDTSNRKDMIRLKNQLENEGIHLNGIIVCTGNTNDSLLKNKDLINSRNVIQTKIDTVKNLDREFLNEKLDFFIMYSSIAAFVPSMGQSDYAYANGYLSAYAEYRNKMQKQGACSGYTLSIAWPFFENGGMKMEKTNQDLMKHIKKLIPLKGEYQYEIMKKLYGINAEAIIVLNGEPDILLKRRSIEGSKVNKVESQDTEITYAVINVLKEKAAQILHEDINKFEATKKFSSYGFDSVISVEFINVINVYYEIKLLPSILFEYTKFSTLANFLVENYKQAVVDKSKIPISSITKSEVADINIEKKKQSQKLDFAIVGIAGRFPGSKDIYEFWKHLENQDDLISQIPKTRWNWEQYWDEETIGKNKTNVIWGGFIDGVDKFDETLFNIAPKEADYMNPQQRLLLESVWSTLENAGYAPSTLRGSNIGVFVGIAGTEYNDICLKNNVDISAYSSMGTAHSIAANRVSYLFDFHGPSEAIDTACSSSLVALNRAIIAMKNNECEAAIVSGVNIILTPSLYIAFDKAGMLSKTGKCSAFDENADGFVRGEGIGTIYIKPLERALEDKDYIYGVIKATGVNHGGDANSLTSPNTSAQKELLEKVYKDANIDFDTITYFETHGTGTILGDSIETNALSAVYQKMCNHNANIKCALGSVKTNIGHLETAAGIAGVIKVLLSMQKGILPGNLNFHQLSPMVNLEHTPYYIIDRTIPWKRAKDINGVEIPRRAGVSSFGFGGTNSHVVLEEYRLDEKHQTFDNNFIIPLSAQTKEQLNAIIKNLVDFLNESTEISMNDIAYTLQNGRDEFKVRFAVCVKERRELINRLNEYLEGDHTNIYFNICTNQLKERMISIHKDENRTYYETLCEEWVKGSKIAWKDYYEGIDVRKVPLPGYVFKANSHWIKSNVSEVEENHKIVCLKREWKQLDDVAVNHLHNKNIVLLCDEVQNNEVVRKLEGYVSKVIISDDINSITCKEYIYILDIRSKGTESQIFQTVANCCQHLLKANVSVHYIYAFNSISSEQKMYAGALESFFKVLSMEVNVKDKTLFTYQLIGYENIENLKKLLICKNEYICYQHGLAYKQVVREFPFIRDFDLGTSRIKDDGIYVVFGGAGGIGNVTVRYLLSTTNARVIVAGRSITNASISEIAQKYDNRVSYMSCDISDISSLRKLKVQIEEMYGAINGIIHSAGQNDDCSFKNKTIDQFMNVIASKTIGCMNIDEIFKQSKLDFILLYTSVAAYYGSAGQTDYCLANRFMEEYATYRNQKVKEGQCYGETIYIAWPIWQNVGMEMADTVKRRLKHLYGMLPITEKQGIEILTSALKENGGNCAYVYREDIKTPELTKTKDVVVYKKMSSLKEAISEYIKEIFSSLVGIEDITKETTLEELCIDSLLVSQFTEMVQRDIGEIDKTILFECTDVGEVVNYMFEKYGNALESKLRNLKEEQENTYELVETKNIHFEENQSSIETEDDIVIIGFEGRFAAANNVDELWEKIKIGEDLTCKVPRDRWNNEKYYSSKPEDSINGKYYCDTAGFLNEVDKFDPLFFHISPKEAELMDPQERLLLEVAWHTIEKAGYSKASIQEKFNNDVGVFVGVTTHTYNLIGSEEIYKGNPDIAKSESWSVANRISYFMNWKGPSLAVDTACSSSLTALHYACQSLKEQETKMVFVGGANLYLHPAKFIYMSQMKMLSKTGVCSAFGEKADGFVPGEGIGGMLLKMRSQAEKDGDHIYGIIKATAINHDGMTNGYTVPNVKEQAKVIQKAIRRSKINPETISYVEAHGTGTQLGDPIEVAGLTKAWNMFTSKKQFCAIGSVKSNIGHSEACAGIASIVKVLLQFQHKQLVPSIHSEVLNEKIQFENSPFYVQHELEDWLPKDNEGMAIPRRAAISSFGAGGTNVHVIMEEYRENTELDKIEEIESGVFTLSARNRKQLEHYAMKFLEYIKAHKLRTQIGSEYALSYNVTESEAAIQLAQVLEVSKESINGQASLEEYGMDLMLFQRYVQALQKTYDYKLDFREMTIDWTLDRIQKYINQKMPNSAVVEDIKYDITLAELVYSAHLKEAFDERLIIEAHSVYEIEKRLEEFLHHDEKGNYVVHNIKQLPLDVEIDWLNGKKVDWLSEEVKIRKLALPTYPFENKRYWTPILKEDRKIKVNTILDENISTFEKQSYCKKMQPNAFYLRDHIVDGVKTLPGVFYLQIAETASKLSLQVDEVILEEITWLKPLRVEDSEKLVKIDLEPLENGCSFKIYTDQDIHMQGKAVKGGQSSIQPQRISIETIRHNCQKYISMDTFYKDFANQGIHYGSTFQCGKSICYSSQEVLAEIELPKGAETLMEYPLHPSILDAAFQATAIYKDIYTIQENEIFIPFGMKRLHTYQPLAEKCFAYIRNIRMQSKMMICDITLVDREGVVLAELLETSFRVLESQQDKGKIHYYTTQWKEQKISITSKGIESVLIFQDEEEINGTLEMPLRIISVYIGSHYEKVTPDKYRINPRKLEDYISLLQDLQADGINALQIIYAWGYRYLNLVEQLQNEYVAYGIQSIFNLCKAIQIGHIESRVKIQVINQEQSGIQNPFFTALCGFLKTIHLENERINVKMITFADTDNISLEILLDELNCQDREIEVRYVSSIRQVKCIRKVHTEKLPIKKIAKNKAVYLITGALGGLAKILIDKICKQEDNASFILTDIVAKGIKSENVINEIMKNGKKAIYVQADLNIKEEVQHVVNLGKEKFEVIHNIIHTAGLIQDEIFRNKQLATLEKVMGPKVYGTLNLDESTKEEPIENFVLFSSLAAFGNSGQCDYAFANDFLVRFGELRNEQRKQGKRQGKTLVMNWSLWSNGGMKTDKQTEEFFEHFGMQALDTDQGMQALYIAMSKGYEQVAIVQGNDKLITKKLESMFLQREIVKNKEKVSHEKGNIFKEKFTTQIVEFIKNLLKIEEELDLSVEISDYGFDSISITELVNKINIFYGLELLPTNVFEYSTMQKFIDHTYINNEQILVVFYEQENREISTSQLEINEETRETEIEETKLREKTYHERYLEQEPIAIIGMSCIMPGADSVEEFWDNLMNQKDVIIEIPKDRWDWKKIYGDSQIESDKTLVNKAGFIKNITQFDEELFGITNREAAFMDPVQRMVLEQSYLALEDAGIQRKELKDTNTGVYIGLVSMEYYELITQHNKVIDPYLSTGNSRAITANRLSYLYGLRGPSEVIDTACSSSIVAVERAIDDIRLGKCDMAIAGGVNAILSPQVHIAYSRTGMLSPEGVCKSFDDSANGYGRGEGCGIIILKPLSKALQDGDNVHALIRGGAINHTGHVNTLTTPNPVAQTEVIVKAVEEAQVPFQSIGYIETHGTGTKLGDPIEITGIKNAEEKLNADKLSHMCVLGSVKTNIGHLEGAAGIAGMIKVIMALKHKVIPANMRFKTQNKYIKLEDTDFAIAIQNTDFPVEHDKYGNAYPRRAGVSSFGFGGVNAHIILEEYENCYMQTDDNQAMHVLTLSARTEELLQSYKESIASWIINNKNDLSSNKELWKSMIYTLQVTREVQPYRMAVVFDNIEELIEKLTNIEQVAIDNWIYKGNIEAKAKDAYHLSLNMTSEEMAQIFVTVNNVTWESCYEGVQQKISLPARPLKKKVHWYQIIKEDIALSEVLRKKIIVSKEMKQAKEQFERDMESLEGYCAKLIMEEFIKKGYFTECERTYSIAQIQEELHIIDKYERLFKEMFVVLSTQKYISVQGDEIVVNSQKNETDVTDWNQGNNAFLEQHSGIWPHIQLLNHCMPYLMEVLQGDIVATDVLFPNASMELVKSVYANNPGADYYNLLVVKATMTYIEEIRKREPKREIRILEVGAGTGGTSKSVLEELAKQGANVLYMYTDMGSSFLNYGKNIYGKTYNFMEFKLLNVELDPIKQGFEPYSYDVIIGANVFHATKDLSKCMKNMKVLLKPAGWIIVNEITKIQAFLSLTFGLTDGWWLYSDEQIRLPGGPLLSVDNWNTLFTKINFKSVEGIDTLLSARTVPQDVIIAQNNDVIEETINPITESKIQEEKNIQSEPVKSVSTIVEESTDTQYLEQYVRTKLVESIAKTLMVETETIDISIPYSEYGIDSILAAECINTINKTLEIKVDVIELFNRANIIHLASYIVQIYQEVLLQREEVQAFIIRQKLFTLLDQYDADEIDLDEIIDKMEIEYGEK